MANLYLEVKESDDKALFERVNEGTHTDADLDSLRKLIRKEPARFGEVGDLCKIASQAAIEAWSGGNALGEEFVRARRELLRQELGYGQALPVERLLIDEIALCWLAHYDAESKYAAIQAKEHKLRQGMYWERKVAATQRRYLRAVETFARVSKLLRSVTMQVNIAEQQVNVAGGEAAAAARAH